MSDEKRNLTVIFPKKQTETNPPKQRIAAYCRVSTQAEEQNHSLIAQVSYYSNLISLSFYDAGITAPAEMAIPAAAQKQQPGYPLQDNPGVLYYFENVSTTAQ